MPEEEAPAVEESVVKASDDATAATEDNSPSKEESKPSSPKEPEQRVDAKRKCEDDQKEASKRPAIDRKKVCPMLLRVFIGDRAHHHPGDFRGRLPDDELQIHTWMDATLKELAGLITEVDPDLIRPGTRFAFNQLFKNHRMPKGHYIPKEMGSVVHGNPGPADERQLRDMQFVIGSFIDVAVFPPNFRKGGTKYR